MTMDAIFFDLDGTLTDPKPGITRSIQYALQKLDLPVPPQDELTWCIGPPLRASFVKSARRSEGRSRRVALSRTLRRCRPVRKQVYPGHRTHPRRAEAVRHGRLFVATSKAHVYADRIIDIRPP